MRSLWVAELLVEGLASATMRAKNKPEASTTATSSVAWMTEECFVDDKHEG